MYIAHLFVRCRVVEPVVPGIPEAFEVVKACYAYSSDGLNVWNYFELVPESESIVSNFLVTCLQLVCLHIIAASNK